MKKDNPASLLTRNLVFTILQPGLVAGLFPYLILREDAAAAMSGPFGMVRAMGSFLFLTGTAILLDCILRFALEGRGTLSPFDLTKKLVVSGFYRYSRNPMYVGVMLILTGEAVFFGSGTLWIYLASVFVAFHVFIVGVEEPRLKRDFGKDYEAYFRNVRRWV